MADGSAVAYRKTPRGSLIETKGKRRPRVTALVRAAADLMASGEVKTIQGAAERLGCRREHLSRQFSKEHVQTYLQHEAKRRFSSAVMRATSVKLDLLDAESEKVRSDVASEVLAMGGIQAPKQGNQTNVSVSVSAGYVIRLDGSQAEPPTIEATATHDISAT